MSLEQRLALGIVLSGEFVLVPGCAVGFDDQSSRGPTKIGNHASAVEEDRNIHIGVFEAGSTNEVEYHVLEHAARRGWAAGNDPSDSRGTRPASLSFEDLHQVDDAQQPQRKRLPDSAPGRTERKPRGQIEHRTRRRRHPDPVVLANVLRVEEPRTVNPDSRVLTRSGTANGDFGMASVPFDKSPQSCSREMAQCRLGTTRFQRCQEPPLEREVDVTDDIDASVQTVQMSDSDTCRDGSIGQTAPAKLVEGENSPCRGRQSRDE